jgi:SAM-dependent methyltransferase
VRADVAKTLDSFGYEWTTFDRIQPEDEAFWQGYFREVDLAALNGRLGLDAGCGKGRYTRFTAGHVGHMVALDGSDAVQAAARNLADLDNVSIVKADLEAIPLRPRSLGFISCLGVLHHLPDPRSGFATLVDLLAPGGLLLVYVYSRPESAGLRAIGLRTATLMRRVTVRLPRPLLRLACAPLALALYALLVVPGAAYKRLPLATYRGKPLRSLWLDTFDRLSAPLEQRYIWSELGHWIEEERLELLSARDDAGWIFLARRP